MIKEFLRRWLFSKVKIKIKLDDFYYMLQHNIDDDCGYDMISAEAYDCLIEPGECKEIPCGISIQMPSSIYAEIKARSSTTRRGFVVLPGIIDPGYRGPLFVTVHNISNKTSVIAKRERIAQLIFHPRVSIDIEQVDKLDDSKRGERGFGSTGRF